MNTLVLAMPDGLLEKLHDIANRRGLRMGDMLVGMCWNLVEYDKKDQQAEHHMSAEELVGFAPRPPGAPKLDS